MIFKVVQRPKLSISLEKNEALKPPWQPSVDLIGCVLTCGNTEDVVELFERALPGERMLVVVN